MCEYTITEYVCGHSLVHSFKICALKSKGRPFQHFPSCKHEEILRKCLWTCAKCHATFQENLKVRGRQAKASCKKKIVGTLKNMFGDQNNNGGFQGLVHVPTSAPRAKRTATLTKQRLEKMTLKTHHSSKDASRKAAISLPYPLEEEEQLGHPATMRRSWLAGDDVAWQKLSRTSRERTSPLSAEISFAPASTKSILETLPSQQGKPLARPDEKIVHSTRARQGTPHRPVESEIGEAQGQNGRKINAPTTPIKKPLQERVVLPVKDSQAEEAENNTGLKEKEPLRRKPLPESASSVWSGNKTRAVRNEIPAPPAGTGIKAQFFVEDYRRRSRADQQESELFLGGEFTKAEETMMEIPVRSTPQIQCAGRRVAALAEYKNVQRMPIPYPARTSKPPSKKQDVKAQSFPSILRPGRRHNACKAQTEGQLPVYYNKRNAGLTMEDEVRWTQYLEWSGIHERNEKDNTWEEYLKWASLGPSSHQSQAQNGRGELAYNKTVHKSDNREAPLTIAGENWSQYLGWAGLSGSNEQLDNGEEHPKLARVGSCSSHSQAQTGAGFFPVSKFCELEPIPHTIETAAQEIGKTTSEEGNRMSFHVSNPGLHGFYSPRPAKSELPIEGGTIKEVNARPAKGEMRVYSKQPRAQVSIPRLQDMRGTPSLWPGPQSAWDRIVVKVVASIDDFSS